MSQKGENTSTSASVVSTLSNSAISGGRGLTRLSQGGSGVMERKALHVRNTKLTVEAAEKIENDSSEIGSRTFTSDA